MLIDYERASQPLSGSNIPEKASKTLPSQYAHFNELSVYSGSLGLVRDLTYFRQAYSAAWVGLCMQVDRNAHGKLPNLDLGSLTPEQRRQKIEEYWNNIADSSSYPKFTQQRAELKRSRYSEGALENWRTPGREFSKLSTPYSRVELVADKFSSVWDMSLVLKAWNYTPHVRDSASGGIDQNVINFHNQVETLGGESMLQYVVALQMLVAGRGLSVGRVTNVAKLLEKDYQGKIVYEIPNPQATIDKLLKRTEPYYLFANRINPVLKRTEKDLFGDNADLARTLWTAASHLRLGRIARPSNGFTSLREPLVKMLVDEKFDDARFYVEELMAQHPQILPDFVAEKLRIEPDVLRGLYADE